MRAHWAGSGQGVLCLSCRPEVPNAASVSGIQLGAAAPEAAQRALPALAARAAPVPDEPWRRLVRYNLDAVRRSAVSDPPLVHERTWSPLPLPREDLVTGRADELPAVGRLTEIAAQVIDSSPGPGDTRANERNSATVFYGWPLLVLEDRTGSRRAVPMLITALVTPAMKAQPFVARDDEPILNPALLTERFFEPAVLLAAQDVLRAGVPFGDPAATRDRLVQVCAALGLDGTTLDPDRLEPPRSGATGVHNTAAAFLAHTPHAIVNLLADLEELQSRADWGTTAARWLVSDVSPGQLPAPSIADSPQPLLPDLVVGALPIALEGRPLNDSQEQAVTAACFQDVTVVTGPPGTGKSQLVASVVANQWVAGRTVLVSSTNNAAVDVAVDRCATFDEGLLVRTGSAEVRRDVLVPTLLRLAARGMVPGPGREMIRRHLEVAGGARREVHDRLAERTVCEAEVAQLVVDTETQRTLLWGSPAKPPLSEDEFRTARRLAHRIARSRWWRRRRQARLVALVQPTTSQVDATDATRWLETEQALVELTARVAGLGPADPERDRADLADVDARWSAAGALALRDTIQDALHRGRTALTQLARQRSAAQRQREHSALLALGGARGWACTALSVRPNFPLQAGLFDLLVIDEASQCSIAHVLPLAYRAKRILVVGDPNQLTPVNTLDPAALHSLAARSGTTEAELHRRALSAGNDSAYTAYAARVARPHLLEEHYRCHPQIARFVNEQFYAGALRILTPVSPDTKRLRGLHLIDVAGRTRRQPGDRGGNYNDEEIEAIATWVQENPDELDDLGIVTPFTTQVARIERRLRSLLGSQVFDDKAITIATAHGFQGGEREVMLFSPVLAADAVPGTVRWVEQQRNLVNVAVSRARRALVVFADTTSLAHAPVPTLHALVELARGQAPAAVMVAELTDISALHSEAERRLFVALAAAGLQPQLKIDVEGYELDFALIGASGPVNVEVDGAHHGDARGRQRRQDLARDQILGNLGWRVLRIPAWRCLTAPEHAAALVSAALT